MMERLNRMEEPHFVQTISLENGSDFEGGGSAVHFQAFAVHHHTLPTHETFFSTVWKKTRPSTGRLVAGWTRRRGVLVRNALYGRRPDPQHHIGTGALLSRYERFSNRPWILAPRPDIQLVHWYRIGRFHLSCVECCLQCRVSLGDCQPRTNSKGGAPKERKGSAVGDSQFASFYR
jgi:hypothetical protein